MPCLSVPFHRALEGGSVSELLPGRQAMRLRDGLIDYLTTTFALIDSDAQSGPRELLEDETEGMFKGPYLRTGMPFNAAPRRAVSPLDWMPPDFDPTPTRRRLSGGSPA